MTEPTPTQKMLANIRALRAQGAPEDVIKDEIAQWMPKIRQHSASERKLTGREKIGAVAATAAQGATFGLTDELSGLIYGDKGRDEIRFLQDQFREENPVASFATEVAGGLAVPGNLVKQAGRSASLLSKVGRVAGEGAAQGALAGIGNAEGDLADRAYGAATGAATGSIAAGFLAGAGRAARPIAGRVREAFGGKAMPETARLERIADQLGDDDILNARRRTNRLAAAGLGDETMLADALPQGEGALRQQAVAGGREARTQVDEALRSRSNRLANLSDERLSEVTGTQRVSGEKARADRLKKAQDEAKPLYDEAREEAGRFDLAASEPDFVTPVVLNRPRIKRAVQRVIADDPERFSGNVFSDPKLSHDLLDQAYKDMGEEIRYLQSKVRAKTASASERRVVKRMIRDRTHLKSALEVRSPTYGKALDKYAGEIAHRDAYDLGAKESAPDMIPEEMASLEPATVGDYRAAKVEQLRGNVPNVDLGQFARFSDALAPIANRQKAETFKATFGQAAYDRYLRDVLEMASLQRMKAGAGESTTVDKLIEQAKADPDNLVGLVRSVMSGSPLQAIAEAGKWDKIIERLRRPQSSKANVDFLMTRGTDNVKKQLDLLEKLRAEGRVPGKTRLPPAIARIVAGRAQAM